MNRAGLSALILVVALVLSGGPVALRAVDAAVLAAGSDIGTSGASGAIKDLAGCGESTLGATDDGWAGPVALPFTANFFGTAYDALFVNNNGNVTFDGSLTRFDAVELIGLGRVIIAPFFADVDTEGDGSGVTTYGEATYEGRPAFCVNWIDVGYYNNRTDKLNKFQLLLIDRSDASLGDFDIMMNYDQIQWETGDSHGEGGLGGASARVGYATGKVSFELPGAGIPASFLDPSPTGLIHSSQDSPVLGRYVFAVRSGLPPTPIPTSTMTPTSTPLPTPAQATPTTPTSFPGDVNCDQTVNAIDAALVLQFGAGLAGSLRCPAGADVNGDTRVNAIDAALILQFAAALIPSLPP